VCGTHAPVVKPPPVTAAPAKRQCQTKITCSWQLMSQPCADKAFNSEYLEPISTASSKGECSRMFRCRHPGQYEMKVTVSDGCTVTTDTVRLTCRCQSRLSVSTGADQTSYYKCQAGATKYDYDTVELKGTFKNEYTGASPDLTPNAVQFCPSKAVDVCEGMSDCCPKTCCAPPCTPCARCPSCPACPMGAGTPGSVPVFRDINVASTLSQAIPGAILRPSRPEQQVPLRGEEKMHNAAPAPVVPAMAIPGAVPGVLSVDEQPAAAQQEQQAYREVLIGNEIAFAAEAEEQEEDDLTAMLAGVILPMSAVFVASMIGNVLLARSIWPAAKQV